MRCPAKCRRVGMADDADSKSVGGNTVWVQVPPPAPRRNGLRSIQKAQPFGWAFLIPLRHSSFSPQNFAAQIFVGAPAALPDGKRASCVSLAAIFFKKSSCAHSAAPRFPAKLCFANFRGGPGRPAGRQTCKRHIACHDFFTKNHRALILLLLASPPCRAATHCAPFKKPGRLAGLSLLFSFQSGTPLAARAFPGENAHGSTALLAHLCRHSQLRGAAFV